MAISHRTQEDTIFDVVNKCILQQLNASEILHNNLNKEDIRSNLKGEIITETSFILTLNDGSGFTIRLIFSQNDIDIRTSTTGDDPHLLAITFATVADNIGNIKKQLLPFHQEVLKLNAA